MSGSSAYNVHGAGRIFLEVFACKICGERRQTGSATWHTAENGKVIAGCVGQWRTKILNSTQCGGIMTTDPVCGMQIDETTTDFQTLFAGKRYFFCSEDCRKEFESEPNDYVESVAA
jgi:YHS domain-containing protein